MVAMMESEDEITVRVGTSQTLMQRATCAVMASGTATLEAAWFGLPYCLIYRVAPLTWQIAKTVVKVDRIGIVNILANKDVVREFLQYDLKAEELAQWVQKQLDNENQRAVLSQELLEVAAKLGDGGVHQRVAHEVESLLAS